MTAPLSEAIAQALHDAGARVATHVPGFGAIQTFEAFQRISKQSLPTSFHEECAYAIAHGAAVAGTRSAVIIKSHGFAKALNAVMDSLSAGVTAGLVVTIFEDSGGSHSDNIIDIEPVVRGCGIPYRMARPDGAYEAVINAFEESERLQLPTAIIFDADAVGTISTFERRGLPEPTPYERDIAQRVVVPLFANYQREILTSKLSGSDWRAIQRPPMPRLPESLPEDYQRAVQPYVPLFRAFEGLSFDFATGDTGVSTLSALPPFEIVHTVGYMGGSIPLAIGAHWAGFNKVWAFTGDFSFIAAGHIGLIECMIRNAPIKVLIFANGKAQTTGGQPLDLAILDALIAGYGKYVRRIGDPANIESSRELLQEVNSSDELRIVVANFAGR